MKPARSFVLAVTLRYNLSMDKNSRPKLTVIQGGRKEKEEWRRYFISAYTTDTRLMGALGLYVHWQAVQGDETADFHQFFYVENEEAGLETYIGLWSSDAQEVAALEKENIGGLGGEKVDLTMTEFTQLLKYYADFNREHGLPLPDKEEEYLHLILAAPEATEEEKIALLEKQCAPITTDAQLINYYLMRQFGQDYDAARLLYITPETFTPLYPEAGISTLCYNKIRPTGEMYSCESLIEHDSRYEVVATLIGITDGKVDFCEKNDVLKVSPQEAALILARPEYISVYEALAPDLDADPLFVTLDFDSVTDIYEYGKLFLSFHDNNSHVDNMEYRLSGDVRGVYYLSDTGQFLMMAYDLPTIRSLEEELAASDLGRFLYLTDKYTFKEPVLYEFIQSDFLDFNEFVQAIREDP